MDWPTIKTTLQAEIERITGLRTRWTGDTTTSGWAVDGFVELDLLRVTTIGQDSLQEKEVDPYDETQIEYQVRGDRQIRVQVLADTVGLFSAVTAIDRVAADLARCPDSLDALNAAGLGLAERAPTGVRSYCDCNQKRRNVSTMDLTFNAAICVDCSIVPTVGTVILLADVLYPDGLTFALQDAEFTIT